MSYCPRKVFEMNATDIETSIECGNYVENSMIVIYNWAAECVWMWDPGMTCTVLLFVSAVSFCCKFVMDFLSGKL